MNKLMAMSLLPPHASWQTGFARDVLLRLVAAGFETRFAGGMVRDLLMGAPPGDIDLATTATPQQMQAVLADITLQPTGIEHGTLTAVQNDVSVEITTLRRDVATDGRHAVVAFSTDFAEDALRRDFTINALYADAQGQVYDTVGGLADLAAQRVRFVGDAPTRIAEDALRILRFCRFSARFGQAFEPEGWQACVAAKAQIGFLSGERIWQELQKMLLAANIAALWPSMAEARLLDAVLPYMASPLRLPRLIALPHDTQDALLRLAALIFDAEVAQNLAARLRLSNADKTQLLALLNPPGFITEATQLPPLLYRYGHRLVRGWWLLGMADGVTPLDTAMVDIFNSWQEPVFPLTGQDILQAGWKTGPEIGHILQALEDSWLRSGFVLSRAELLKIIPKA